MWRLGILTLKSLMAYSRLQTTDLTDPHIHTWLFEQLMHPYPLHNAPQICDVKRSSVTAFQML